MSVIVAAQLCVTAAASKTPFHTFQLSYQTTAHAFVVSSCGAQLTEMHSGAAVVFTLFDFIIVVFFFCFAAIVTFETRLRQNKNKRRKIAEYCQVCNVVTTLIAVAVNRSGGH